VENKLPKEILNSISSPKFDSESLWEAIELKHGKKGGSFLFGYNAVYDTMAVQILDSKGKKELWVELPFVDFASCFKSMLKIRLLRKNNGLSSSD